MRSYLTSGVHSLDLIGGPAWTAGSQFVKSSDSVGIPLTLDEARHLEPRGRKGEGEKGEGEGGREGVEEGGNINMKQSPDHKDQIQPHSGQLSHLSSGMGSPQGSHLSVPR